MSRLKKDMHRDLGAVFDAYVKDGEEFIVCVCLDTYLKITLHGPME